MNCWLKKILLFAGIGLMVASCGTYEQYVLLNDVQTPHEYAAPVRHDLKIKKGDNLQILVAHHTPMLVEQFNQKISSVGNTEKINTYVVNSNGYISMPVFDTIHVAGMTCRELENYLVKRLESEGIAFGATVSVKIVNIKVTVIGESGTGVYSFDSDCATIFDLVAKASIAGGGGESTIRRDKILVMRDCDSTIRTEYISLLSTDLLYSPYFYLQQNDVFYVYPSKTTIRRSNQIFDYWWSRVSFVTSLASVATLIVTLVTSNKQ